MLCCVVCALNWCGLTHNVSKCVVTITTNNTVRLYGAESEFVSAQSG